MKKHISNITITEAGIDHKFRAEITEHESGKCNVKIFRVYADGKEYERTQRGGIDRNSLKAAKQYVRETFNTSFGKHQDLRLKWTQEATE